MSGSAGDNSIPADHARTPLRAWLHALRPHQWLKNLLLFVPALAAHQLDAPTLTQAGIAWLAFSVCASGTYVMNDLRDLQADRHHPRKRNRAFARGDLPAAHGMLAAPILVLASFAIALWLPWAFMWDLAAYVLLTLCYTLTLKTIVALDVLTLAALYTIRIIAGGAATSIPVSWWLIGLSIFLFLGLALLKRYTELQDVQARGGCSAKGRGYHVNQLALVQTLGISSGIISVAVLGFYIESNTSTVLYAAPVLLWLLCPLLLAWIAWLWHCARRGQMHDDPLVFAARDPASLIVLALGTLVVYGAI